MFRSSLLLRLLFWLRLRMWLRLLFWLRLRMRLCLLFWLRLRMRLRLLFWLHLRTLCLLSRLRLLHYLRSLFAFRRYARLRLWLRRCSPLFLLRTLWTVDTRGRWRRRALFRLFPRQLTSHHLWTRCFFFRLLLRGLRYSLTLRLLLTLALRPLCFTLGALRLHLLLSLLLFERLHLSTRVSVSTRRVSRKLCHLLATRRVIRCGDRWASNLPPLARCLI
jgi:hypothetical protein